MPNTTGEEMKRLLCGLKKFMADCLSLPLEVFKMVVTNLGKCFARGIHAGTLTLIEIPDKHLQNTKDSYLELFGVPVEAAEW